MAVIMIALELPPNIYAILSKRLIKNETTMEQEIVGLICNGLAQERKYAQSHKRKIRRR